MFVGKHHKGYEFLRGLSGEPCSEVKDIAIFEIEPSYFNGISGTVFRSEQCIEPEGYSEIKFDHV